MMGSWRESLGKYRDVLVFVVCLFVANGLWKLMIHGDEDVNEVFWFGLDVTPVFRTVAGHITQVVYRLTRLVSDSVHLVPPYTVSFDSGFAYSVVWSCTPLKQSFIWLFIMLFARGSLRRKLWFVPLGWLVAYAFNIFRITAIGLLCEHHPDMFEFYHLYLFKYLFYAVLFALWVWWTERVAGNDKKTDKI